MGRMVHMKYSEFVFALFLLVSFFLLNNCDVVTEKNDACDKTKWAEVKEPIMYVYIGLGGYYCDPPANAHYIPAATQMICSGKITKIYCDGTVSGSFNINTTFYPSQMTQGELDWVKIGQAYQFKFQNDNDYLLLTGRLTGTFSDGKKYESDEFSARIYYKNINYNVNTLENWTRFLVPELTKWYQVN